MSWRVVTLLFFCAFFYFTASDEVARLTIVLFCSILIIKAKDPNIRFLVAASSFIYLFFYELNTFLFFLTSDVFQTGNVVGDLLLNVVGILGNVCGIMLVIHRDKLMEVFYNTLALESVEYFSLEADVVQARAIKIILIVNFIATVVLALVAILYFSIDGFADPDRKEDVRLLFRDISYLHVQVWHYLDIVLYVVLAYLIHEDCLVKRSDKVRSFKF